MEEVSALIGDVLMKQAVFQYGFLIIFRARLHSVQPPLKMHQLFLGLFQPAGWISPVALVVHIKVAQGIFQPQGALRNGKDRLRRLYQAFIQDISVIAARPGLFHCDALEFPPVLRAAWKDGPNHSCLGHADAVPRGINGRAGSKHMIAGGEGVPVIFFSLKIGMPKSLRVLKKQTERPGQLVVLLNECLIIHFF